MSKTKGSKVSASAFCLARIRPQVRVKSPVIALPKPPPVQQVETDKKLDHGDNGSEPGVVKVSRNASQKKMSSFAGRKIMIVVDSSFEAKGALQWALTHTIQNTDLVTLLHVVSINTDKPSTQGRELSEDEIPQKVDQLLKSMKKLCQSAKPEVEVEVLVVAGKDKGGTIVAEAKRKGTGMLVLGQKKRSTILQLLMMWKGGSRVGGGLTVAEYCIQNAPCITIAVRRKSKKHGGYLITTKRHKDFWLLA